MPKEPEDQPQKPFRVQKRRLGTIRFIRDDGEFGFIEAEDFRDDVFFHRTVWEADRPNALPAIQMFVEFEIDDEYFATEKRLRATKVRRTNRPEGRKLSGRDAPHLIIQHHPNARKKRPNWRQ